MVTEVETFFPSHGISYWNSPQGRRQEHLLRWEWGRESCHEGAKEGN